MKNSIVKLGLSSLIICSGYIVNAQTFEEGAKQLEYEQYKKAKGILKKVYSKEPNHAKCAYKLGELYFTEGNSDSASFYYNAGILSDPSEPLNYIGSAKILLNKADNAGADEMIKKAKSKAGKDITYLLALSKAYCTIKTPNYPNALASLEKAKEINYKSASLYDAYGDYYALTKDIGTAINSYKNATFYDKNDAYAFYKIGVLYLNGRNLENDGLVNLQEAIKIDSLYLPAYREMGELYLKYGKYDKSAESYKTFIRLSEYNRAVQIKYASALFLCKKYDESEMEVKKMQEKDPQLPDLMRLSAFIAYEKKDYLKGQSLLEEYMKKTEANKRYSLDYEYYGNFLFQNKSDSLAINNYLKAIELDSTKTNLYENIAKIYDKKGQLKETVFYYDKLIRSKTSVPSTDYFLKGRAAYYFGADTLSGDTTIRYQYLRMADSCFAKVAELSPKSYLGTFWRGRVNAALDPNTTLGLSKPFFEQAIAIMELVPDKYKKELIEAYKYLGYYYYKQMNDPKVKPADKTMYKESSLDWWSKILSIDPKDASALDAIKVIK